MVDVAIVGGGPAACTCAALLKKYMPGLEVLILEREKMPREHVGESLLPAIPVVLDEMGAWDKVEAADFPIKVGATFRWGKGSNLWDFDFLPFAQFHDEPRPAKFAGQRKFTAWQVDRSIFDKVLLDHAASVGCDVREETKVVEILHTGDRVDGFKLESGEIVQAKYYLDASGGSSILRKAMGVEADYPTKLRNIAIWQYWENTEWAVEIGTGGTRILIMSVGYGWIWFIPIGPTRTSVGLVVPLEYYKQSGKRPLEIYEQALVDQPTISGLMEEATTNGKVYTTNDWSYIADRLIGENWFLIGDSCGFADPILSAGLTLAMTGARQVAYSIMEMERGNHDPAWLKSFYDSNQKAKIRSHIMFADYWYSANAQFTDLIDYTSEIAKQAGHDLSPDAAFRWLASGGFANEDPSLPMAGGCALPAVKGISERLSQKRATWTYEKNNVFELDLAGAKEDTFPVLFEGKVLAKPCYKRGNKILPMYGVFDVVIETLRKEVFIGPITDSLHARFTRQGNASAADVGVHISLATLEAMVADGWVKCGVDDNEDFIDFDIPEETPEIHTNQDIALYG